MARVLLLSPYHGGSHRAFAEGLADHSRHEIVPLTLPARFWKWRMHGGAVTLAREFLALELRPDLILMDIQLPGMNGLEATRIIKEDPELMNVPVVALTSFAMQGDEEKR